MKSKKGERAQKTERDQRKIAGKLQKMGKKWEEKGNCEIYDFTAIRSL